MVDGGSITGSVTLIAKKIPKGTGKLHENRRIVRAVGLLAADRPLRVAACHLTQIIESDYGHRQA
jgi:hypothetical protein